MLIYYIINSFISIFYMLRSENIIFHIPIYKFIYIILYTIILILVTRGSIELNGEIIEYFLMLFRVPSYIYLM